MHEPLDRAPTPMEPAEAAPVDVAPPARRADRVWLHVLLFVLTLISTTLVGALHYESFRRGFNGGAGFPDLRDLYLYLHGLWYSGTVLAILGCHEMGHYVACRYYRVDASLPYFLPMPLLLLTGTLGAVIRIRQRFPSKIALFDIGIAGPIAGFLVSVPALLAGLAMSNIERVPDAFNGYELGEPLLFRAAAWLVWGDLPNHMSINMHPMAFAAWFGLFATALNLFPIGQLDGGHVTFAVIGRRSSYITITMVCVAIALTFVSTSWILWSILMVVMLFVMGPHHPPTLDDHVRLGNTRLAVAAFGLVMLILCFSPVPIEQLVTGQ